MAQTASNQQRANGPSGPEAPAGSTAGLLEAMRRCPPEAVEAAHSFQATGDISHLPAIVRGIIGHYVEPGLRGRLADAADRTRLNEDLGIDSLTLMEIAMLAEDVLQVAIDNGELRHLRTLDDFQRFIELKVRNPLGTRSRFRASDPT